MNRPDRRIFDVFMYNGDAIADARIEYLQDHIDQFVVLEGTHTFTGTPKPKLHSADAPWRDHPKITIVEFAPPEEGPSTDPWVNENALRNAGYEALLELGAQTDDIVVSCDVDEIPNGDTLEDLRLKDSFPPMVLDQAFYYYNFRNRKPSRWKNAIIARFGDLKPGDLQLNRGAVHRLKVRQSGWHLSYADTPDKLRTKLESFSHKELDRPEFKSDAHIKDCIETGKDLFGRRGEDCNRATDAEMARLPKALRDFHRALTRKQKVPV